MDIPDNGFVGRNCGTDGCCDVVWFTVAEDSDDLSAITNREVAGEVLER